MKKFLLGIVAVFLFIFAFANITNAAATNTSKRTEVPHWQKSPINVFVPNEAKAGSMKNAFNTWAAKSSGKIRFEYTDKKRADIIVEFTNNTEGLESKLGGYSLLTNGTTITNATIKIATKSKEAKKYSSNYIYTTMLHEVGHVLGLKDNPRKPTSIMYMPITEKQDIMKIDIRQLYNVNGWSYADRNMPSQRNK